MSIFQDVTFGFKGEEFTVPHNKVMKLIAIIEDIVTLRDLTDPQGPKLSRLSKAYAEALKFAGKKVETEEVYATLFGDGASASVSGSISSLIMLMLPPDTYNPPESQAGKQKAVE